MKKQNRLTAVTNIQRQRLQQAKDDAARQTVAKEAEASRAAIADETLARLVEEYERGAVLDFFFADRLRDWQASGFDIGNFFAEMIAGIDSRARKTSAWPKSHPRKIVRWAARKAHPRYSLWLIDPSAEGREGGW